MPRTAHRPFVGLFVVVGLGLAVGLSLAAAGAARAVPASELGVPWWIYVGHPAGPESKGIYLFQMKTSENPDIPEFVTMTPLGLVAETPSPAFLELDPKRRLLFAVNESRQLRGQDVGRGQRVRHRPGHRQAEADQPAAVDGRAPLPPGAGPRRASTCWSPTASGGSVAVLPVAADGKLGAATDVRQHTGKSVHPSASGPARPRRDLRPRQPLRLRLRPGAGPGARRTGSTPQRQAGAARPGLRPR